MRYFFHIAYLGKNYSGWQKQKNIFSVQQVVEDKLSQVLKTPVAINGCGRTDAKVNASQFFFHADFEQPLEAHILFRLNRILPYDIAIFDIIPVKEQAHARFDGILRRYDYFIHTQKDPFLSEYSTLYLNLSLDFDKLKKATDLLTQYQDYRPFCTSPDKNEHTICHVSEAKWWISEDGKRLRFQITSNRFLTKMIRIVVGQLLRVGKGDLCLDAFEHYLKALETPKILSPAHPQGLYLSKITYPYLNLLPKTDFFGLQQIPSDWKPIS